MRFAIVWVEPEQEQTAESKSTMPDLPAKMIVYTETQTKGRKQPPRPDAYLNYNKFLKELDIKSKRQLLAQLLCGLLEPYAANLGLLQSSLRIFRDTQGNLVLRPRKRAALRPSVLKPRNSSPLGKVPARHPLKKDRRKTSVHAGDVESETQENRAATAGCEESKRVRASASGRKSAMGEMEENNDLSRVSLRSYVSHKPVAGIKIVHKDYEHLADHEINQAIVMINRFLGITFRNRDSTYDVELILKLAKTMKLPLVKKSVNAATFKSSRESVYALKEQLSRYLASVVNRSNGVVVPESLPKATQYKFFVGKGNNSIMVRNILKQRWWWNYGPRNDENLNLLWTQWYKPKYIATLPSFKPGETKPEVDPRAQRTTNHMERHYHISNKKAMFINLQRYYQLNGEDPFDTLPLTFHIRGGASDPEFARFVDYYKKLDASIAEKRKTDRKKAEHNVWIIKPGEYSNRGCGISVMQSLAEIQDLIGGNGKRPHTYIIQKYIEKPLLVGKRKFDIRMYGMLTSINGIMKGYFYEEGYLRTSCKEYSLKNLANKAIHLTNDAVQQKFEDYGKYEPGNKMSFPDFQRYLDTTFPTLNIDFYRDLLPQIKVRLDYPHGVENRDRHLSRSLHHHRPTQAPSLLRSIRIRLHVRRGLQGVPDRGQH